MIPKKHHQGVTVLEILLVLVVAATLIWVALIAYQGYRRDQEVEQVKYNINMILLGMKNFYHAECGQNKKLDPNSASSPGFPYPIDIGVDLVNFIPKWPPIAVSFIDNSMVNAGYIAQYNEYNAKTRGLTACFLDYTQNPPTLNCAQQRIQNESQYQPTTVLITSQIAIKITDSSKVDAYQKLLGADCISSIEIEDKIVKPCYPAPPHGDYLVWERLPTLQPSQLMTSDWLFSPIVKQFNLQYTHDLMYEFNNPDWAKTQSYLCGG